LALTGKALQFLIKQENPALLNSVLARASVFARMSPEDKAQLIEKLQQVLEHPIGMCGDGANDCAALKQADVGISLS
jgi:cation-transporting ATPase 13A2